MYKIEWTKYLSEKRLKDSSVNPFPRNSFESDFGRVAFSSALRRMHDKTQVFPLTNGDCIHTRLTHSIEVMNIAHSLGIYLARDEEFIQLYGKEGALLFEQNICPLLRTAALVHDIGNPPFGHFGEMIIQDYFKKKVDNGEVKFNCNEDFTQFDGNAQGFRILTKLMYTGNLRGLNLTFGTLGAFLKYPNTGVAKQTSYIGDKKHGVFYSEKEVLDKIIDACSLRTDTGTIKRHPLSFLVEASDSICYRIMDIEDGIYLKWFTLQELINFSKETHDLNILDSLDIIENDLLNLNENDQIVRFRVKLIDYFVSEAIKNYKEHLKEIEEGTYNKELIEEDSKGIEKVLKDFTSKFIFCRKEVQLAELTGKAVIPGLFDILFQIMDHKDKQFRNRITSSISNSALKVMKHLHDYPTADYHRFIRWELSEIDYSKYNCEEKYRLLLDFISGMTDWYALDLYQKLKGVCAPNQ